MTGEEVTSLIDQIIRWGKEMTKKLCPLNKTPFEIKYPRIWGLLKGSAFEEEARVAGKMTKPEFKAALEGGRFKFTALIDLLCGAVVPDWSNEKATELEENLAEIVATVGDGKARSAFRDKLLVQDVNALEDTCYEIFVAARACSVLNEGSVELEKPIRDPGNPGKSLKNSDVYGTFGSMPVRIEVTVLHEKRPTDSVSTRIISPHYLKEDFENPKGVFDVTDLPEFEGQHPISKKIREMIQGKLQQCEPGVMNIVAFGNPNPMDDDEVVNALFGAPFVAVSTKTDEHGYRKCGDGRLCRAQKAPFNRMENLSEDDQRTFVEPFRNLSAVWHIRIGGCRKSDVLVNPNARVGVPSALVAFLKK